MNWRPAAKLDVLKLRARMLGRVRAFFAERGVLEVETPLLSAAATTDRNLASLATRYTGPVFPNGKALYLHTSPEFAMKRLLAAGAGSIYQLCKVFRDAEAGRLHNPEFTMLEWYRVDLGQHALMDEVAALVSLVLGDRAPSDVEKTTYRDAFMQRINLDPHSASVKEFTERAHRHGVSVPKDMPHDRLDPWRDLLLTHVIEPQLGRGKMTFLYDYPASQAALAQVRASDPPVAERFELYIDGIEIANGFHELTDAAEQRRRFEQDLAHRRTHGLAELPMDHRLLGALTHGMPDCSGVALGFDRLVMIAADAKSIDEVLAFPLERA
jgi:elongation factor P--(R)-beta-lysine ligase